MNHSAGAWEASRRAGGAVLLSQYEFSEWLQQKVKERVPAAIVRLGVGEARLLTAHMDDDEAQRAIRSHLYQETGLEFSVEDGLAIKALAKCAYDQADVLGIRFSDLLPTMPRMWMNRLMADYTIKVREGRSPTVIAHSLLNHDIAGELPQLLAGHSVSVISCRDLKPILETKWGLEDVAVYQVPSQYTVRDIDGDYEAAMHGTPIWPDAHACLHADLTVREPGEVFLVGAGLFGKDLCIRIRELGGIALDMGSALDNIAGKITRGPERRILDFHADGMSLDNIVARLEDFYGVRVDRDITREISDVFLDDLLIWRRRRLDMTYTAVHFNALQVEVGVKQIGQCRTCYLAWGITRDGCRDPIGMWWQNSESEFWPAVFTDLHERGLRDLSVVCLPDIPIRDLSAVKALFPRVRIQAEVEPEELSAAIRRAIEVHGGFANAQDASILIFVALRRAGARERKVESRTDTSC